MIEDLLAASSLEVGSRAKAIQERTGVWFSWECGSAWRTDQREVSRPAGHGSGGRFTKARPFAR